MRLFVHKHTKQVFAVKSETELPASQEYYYGSEYNELEWLEKPRDIEYELEIKQTEVEHLNKVIEKLEKKIKKLKENK